MLKFNITNSNSLADAKTLVITETKFAEENENEVYDILDDDLDIISVSNNRQTIEFSVKDIMGIQTDSHLIGVNRIVVSNEENATNNTYEYFEELVVDSCSRADKKFTIKINKDLPLDIENISIETRYNAIRFIGSRWVMMRVDKEWLVKNDVYGDPSLLIDITQAACGRNERTINFEGDNYDEYEVFYYENECWKVLSLIDVDNLEKCKNGENIILGEGGGGFHMYDKTQRPIFNLDDKKKIYYTQETYISFNSYPSHYFTTPKITYKIKDSEDIISQEITDYGRPIELEVEYPLVKFNYEEEFEGIIIDKTLNYVVGDDTKRGIECHIENDSQLCFNYDKLDDNDKKVLIDHLFPSDLKHDIDMDVEKQDGLGGIFEITRNNIMYNDEYVSFDLIYDTATNVIQIPISQRFETDMYHNDALNIHFVEEEIANSVNRVMDLEKDVYTPAIYQPSKNEGTDKGYYHINANYRDCFKIIFNLHFREHRDTMNGEKWKCENECYWNGTNILTKKIDGEDKKIIDLKGRVFQYKGNIGKEEKYDYFSYFGELPDNLNPTDIRENGFDKPNGNDDYNIESVTYKEDRIKRNSLKEYQSDLLSYLGFSNDDVKFQKSKLKKSFLRISFYDSDNVANQNLLHTATIFIDSGNLFAKYIRNIETEDLYEVKEEFSHNGTVYEIGELIEGKFYRSLSLENQQKCQIGGSPLAVIGGSGIGMEYFTKYDENGLRVNREPMRLTEMNISSDFGDTISTHEDLRMSSQIEIVDKNSSKRSSEGFYFYTYRNNDNGVYPSDIYMRVDFNHAGYGRTIPFMMPYIRKVEEDKENGIARYNGSLTSFNRKGNKIKTFDDICYDWSEIDYDDNITKVKDENDVGYGTIRYMKYAYIKWKYRYDKYTQKHIYYLDPDVYGEGVTTNNNHGNNIILNLYEGKIR